TSAIPKPGMKSWSWVTIDAEKRVDPAGFDTRSVRVAKTFSATSGTPGEGMIDAGGPAARAVGGEPDWRPRREPAASNARSPSDSATSVAAGASFVSAPRSGAWLRRADE